MSMSCASVLLGWVMANKEFLKGGGSKSGLFFDNEKGSIKKSFKKEED